MSRLQIFDGIIYQDQKKTKKKTVGTALLGIPPSRIYGHPSVGTMTNPDVLETTGSSAV